MKIKRLDIEKFRSIKQSSLTLKELNAIVGENNSGKTSILRAINCIFHFDEEEKFFWITHIDLLQDLMQK